MMECYLCSSDPCRCDKIDLSTPTQFYLDQRVRFYITEELQGTGTILGNPSLGILDTYIVLLDKPLKTHKAIVALGKCLKKL